MKIPWAGILMSVLAMSIPLAAWPDPPSHVPKDRIAAIDDLYGKWREVREGKSKAVLLDVRTPKEYGSGHIPGSKNIPSDRPTLVREYWPDPGTEIWVYCRTQRRSMEFASFLYRHGYVNVFVVEGGILAWAEKGYPLDASR